jgi:tetratricopeptide (TPR) repeat protein
LLILKLAGDFGEGQVEYYQQAVKLDPRRIVSWGQMSMALAELGQAEEALACLDQALIHHASEADLWVKRSWVLSNLLNRFEDAVESCDRALALDPYSQAYLYLGKLFYDRGAWQEALPYFEEAARLGHPEAEQYAASARQRLDHR